MKRLLFYFLAALGALSLMLFIIRTFAFPAYLKFAQQSVAAPRVEPFTTEGVQKRGVIVFVHGFRGSIDTTWKNPKTGKSWFQLMAEDPEFSAFEIEGFQYSTGIAGAQESIRTAVEFLAARLQQLYETHEQVIIIAHSLGGIVSSFAVNESFVNKRRGTVVKLISLATPFRGSGLADALEVVAGQSVVSEHAVALKISSPYRDLFFEKTWPEFRVRYKNEFRQFVAYEGNSIVDPLNLLVVQPDSAKYGIHDDVETRKFEDLDHDEMSCPPDCECDLYNAVKAWIFAAERHRVTFANVPEGFAETAFRTFVVSPGVPPITSDIELPPSSVLEIQSGVHLRFTNGSRLICNGKLIALGTPDEPIHFDFDETSDSASGLYLEGVSTEGSVFRNCIFDQGNGLEFYRGLSPKDSPSTWRDETGLTTLVQKFKPGVDDQHKDSKRYGGAVLLFDARQVVFDQCQFLRNSAWQGGAVALVGSDSIHFSNCNFTSNTAGYGAGGLFAQCSTFDATDCLFENNVAGPPYTQEPERRDALTLQEHACGGAIYLAFQSRANIIGCKFKHNRSKYVGGALYAGDSSKLDARGAGIIYSMFVKSVFEGNTAGTSGGAIHLDDYSRINLTDCAFEACRVDDLTQPGQAICDNSMVDGMSGLKSNGLNLFIGYRPSFTGSMGSAVDSAIDNNWKFVPQMAHTASESQPATTDDFQAEDGPPQLRVIESLMASPESYSVSKEDRHINTIVIHHTSAINWEADDFQAQFGKQLNEFEQALDPSTIKERKYDWRFCKEIFELYHVSAHYLIDREGNIRQLVKDNDVAYHAGQSEMPQPDGRGNVNTFSIGIELISSHPNDDPTVQNGEIPAYTDAQYASLAALVKSLCEKYPITRANIVGHDQIAPGRKSDPGPLFDWNRLFSTL